MQVSPDDPLARLAAEPAVAAAVLAARDEIDALLWRRDVRGAAPEVAAASRERGARESAAIDGADLVVADTSPMGRVLEAAQRLTDAVPGQVDVFAQAPMQAWAHLHALVAHGFVAADGLGRPRADDRADDPLHLGAPPPASVVGERLAGLVRVLTAPTEAPAVFVAGIAHAELAVLRAFAWGSGLMARATVRLVLAARGVDPSLFSVPEHGVAELGRPAYVLALRAYASGTSAGVAEFSVWHATAVAIGARTVPPP